MPAELISHIQKHVDLNQSESETVKNYVVVKTFAKKEFLLTAGEVCNNSFFVLQGCLRLYTIQPDGKEHIIQFALENWWLSDYTSFSQNIPSIYNIQATENTRVAILSGHSQAALLNEIPQLERYFRLIFERAYAAALWRINQIFCSTGEERYFQFVKAFPGFIQRIPQYMLASFLGLTPEFLSIIRAKK